MNSKVVLNSAIQGASADFKMQGLQLYSRFLSIVAGMDPKPVRGGLERHLNTFLAAQDILEGSDLYSEVWAQKEHLDTISSATAIEVKSWKELPDSADVELYISSDEQLRYVRWKAGDNTDKQPPKVLYRAPAWVWQLYQQGFDKGFKIRRKL
jgi:hypothetical protein